MPLGGFILLCLIAWTVWWTIKKPKKDSTTTGGFRGLPRRISSKLPFLRHWRSLDSNDSSVTGSPPPSYREKAGSENAQSAAGCFGPEQIQVLQQPQSRWPLGNPGLLPPEAGPLHFHSVDQPQVGHENVHATASGTNLAVPNFPAYAHQTRGPFNSPAATQFSLAMPADSPVTAVPMGFAASTYYHSTAAVPPPFTTPYNPIHRQASFATSDTSSLSSGFGDGDIVAADSPVTPPQPAAVAAANAAVTPPPSSNPLHAYKYTTTTTTTTTTRFSWMSQPAEPDQPHHWVHVQSRPEASRRETACTEASEDRPARFRSIASWVDQQTGRIRRAQQRGQPPPAARIPGHPGIPGVHNPPDEQSFELMMDDGEVPRPVEDALGGAGRAWLVTSWERGSGR